jgi:trehalose-phosphatase
VEDKGLTLSVHYRQAPEAALPELTARVAGLVGGIPALELRGGKMSLEVRPRLAWDKGQAVLKLAGLLATEADWGLLYAGDDATDEDAFRVVGGSERGVAILIGERGDTFADFRLPDPEALRELLEALLRELPWR